jgi:hypothetical protein
MGVAEQADGQTGWLDLEKQFPGYLLIPAEGDLKISITPTVIGRFPENGQ